MAASPIATLRIMLSADDAEMRTALGRTDKQSKKWAAAQKRRAQATAQAFKQVGVAVAALGTAYIASTKRAIEQADVLAKQSKTLGITVQQLQEYTFAAERSGVSTEEMVKGLQQFNKFVGQAARGTGTAKKAFQVLGIPMTDINGNLRGSEELMYDFMDALSKIESPAMRAGLAADVFGRAGVKLLPLMKDGSKGMDELRQAARDLGLVMENETAAKAEVLNDKLGAFTEILTTKMNSALIESAETSLPAIVRALDVTEGMLTGVGATVSLLSARFDYWRAGLYGYGSAILGTFREVTNFIKYAADTAGTRIKILTDNIKLGMIEMASGAISVADKVMSKAPDWYKALIGYGDGDYQRGAESMKNMIRANIAALESELEVARQKYDDNNQPSLLEQTLTSLKESTLAEAEASIAEAKSRFQTAAGLVTGEAGGVATAVNTTIGGLGTPDAGAGEGVDAGSDEADEAHQKILAQKLAEAEAEKNLVDVRRNTMQQSIAFAQGLVKEGSAAAKVLMAVQTALNVAQIMSNTEVAKMRAMAELGPVAGPPMAAAIQAQGLVSAGIAAATGVMGMFHDGIDNVPNTGTYLLEKGERVVDKRLNEDLTKSLQGGGGIGGGANITFSVQGVEDPDVINRVINENRAEFETMLRNINADRAGAGLL